MKNQHADQSAKRRETFYRIRLLPLLNGLGYEKKPTNYQLCKYMQDVCSAVVVIVVVIKVFIFFT
jgi:hypothetical protein